MFTPIVLAQQHSNVGIGTSASYQVISTTTTTTTSSSVTGDFVAQCQSLCNDYLSTGSLAAAAKFCFTRMSTTPDMDLNKPFHTDIMLLDVCPDAVYCFHVTTCKSDTQQIDITNCRQVLCNANYQVYQDYNHANNKVKTYFPNGIGSCSIPADDANWYNLYFGSNPCISQSFPTPFFMTMLNSSYQRVTSSSSTSTSVPSSGGVVTIIIGNPTTTTTQANNLTDQIQQLQNENQQLKNQVNYLEMIIKILTNFLNSLGIK